jgi:Carbohydrate esterase, sialic acid-specific acetylesterase
MPTPRVTSASASWSLTIVPIRIAPISHNFRDALHVARSHWFALDSRLMPNGLVGKYTAKHALLIAALLGVTSNACTETPIGRKLVMRFATLSTGVFFALVVLHGVAEAAGFNDTAGRARVICHAENTNDIVLLTFGQSISASHGEAGYTPRGNVVNFNPNDSLCYVAKDPMLGATAGSDGVHVGSIWGYLCDDLLATGYWNRCIIAPIAQGGTSMESWDPGGSNYPLIEQAVKGMRANELLPTLLLYGQGEVDASAKADPVAYQTHFNQMVDGVRSLSSAPILVAVETICYNGGASPDLEPVDKNTRVAKWIGQDKDTAGPASRGEPIPAYSSWT